MQIEISIPYEVAFILWKMHTAGYETYLVGGAVRDLLINSLFSFQSKTNKTNTILDYHEIVDYDFTTNATPQQIQQVFPDSYYTNEFGMVGISYQNLNANIVAEGFFLPKENIATRTNSQAKPRSSRIIDLANASKVHTSLSSQVDNAQNLLKTNNLEPPPFEITTYRSEGMYSDFRRPDEVIWGNSINQDLERRDFTINAMALEVKVATLNSFFSKQNLLPLLKLKPKDYSLVDQHMGLKDLAKKIISTVRNPDERFQEDALRMLRAIRLSSQLEFALEPLTLASIKHHANLLRKISWERIQTEFLKMLSSPQPSKGIALLYETGLLDIILPELISCKNVEQGGHHNTDVWTHSLDSLDNCPSNNPIVRLAALVHDIGKPKTFQLRNGEITFYNHEIVSSRMADQVAKRLKLSNDQRKQLFKLVRYHMFYYQPHDTDAAIRRMIKRVGIEYIDDILDLREGDRLGSGAKKTSWRLEELKKRIIEQLNQPMDTNDLIIDGNDLISQLHLKPGKIIGDILNYLLEKVLEQPELNTKEALLEETKLFLKQQNQPRS